MLFVAYPYIPIASGLEAYRIAAVTNKDSYAKRVPHNGGCYGDKLEETIANQINCQAMCLDRNCLCYENSRVDNICKLYVS